MIPCRCQTTGHDSGCPNRTEGPYALGADGVLYKTEPLLYSQRQYDLGVEGGRKIGFEEGFKQAYAETSRIGYGSAVITDCPRCGKPDVHWSTSSHLYCHECQKDGRLNAAQYRIHELEKLSEMLLAMANPFCGLCGKRPDPEGPLCSYAWAMAKWVCVECARG
jgi:hypothetical protein